MRELLAVGRLGLGGLTRCREVVEFSLGGVGLSAGLVRNWTVGDLRALDAVHGGLGGGLDVCWRG